MRICHIEALMAAAEMDRHDAEIEAQQRREQSGG